MKTAESRWSIGNSLAAVVVGLSALIPVSANAAHEMLYAVDTSDNLISFWSDAPGTLLNAYAISGLQANEEIRGLDYYDGVMYGLGSFNHLYAVNQFGIASQVGGIISPPVSGLTFGVDNGPAGFQVTSGLSGGQSLLIDRTTAAATVEPSLHYAVGDPNFGLGPRMDALAYDAASGKWYAGDTLQNSLALFDPATGVLNTIGLLGIDASRYNGLDISAASDVMYMGTPAASSDPQANLYSVNKTTGVATLIGQIGSPGDNTLVRGLTVVPVVPEPSSLALLVLGAAGFFFARRRQQ